MIADAGVSKSSINSDHRAIYTKFNKTKYSRKRYDKRKPNFPAPPPKVNWTNLRDVDKATHFSSEVSTAFSSNQSSYNHLAKCITSAANATLIDNRPHNPPWFNLSESTLTPLINTRNSTQHLYFTPPTPALKTNFSLVRTAIKKAVKAAKLKWLEKQAIKVKDLNLNPKDAWDTIKMLRQGLSHHHHKPKTDTMKSEEGELSSTDKEHANIFGKHFRKVQ